MKTCWTKGLDPERTIEVRKDYVGSAILRRRMKELLLERIDNSYTQSVSKDGYQNPSWAYLQADARGYERAMKELLSLIED